MSTHYWRVYVTNAPGKTFPLRRLPLIVAGTHENALRTAWRVTDSWRPVWLQPVQP